MRNALHAVLLIAVSSSCSCPQKTTSAPTAAAAPAEPSAPAPAGEPTPAGRTPSIPAAHPQHARVEGTSFQNGCAADADCRVGGCSSEVCSAEEGVNSTCEMPADGWPTAGSACGCVAGQCQWWKPTAGEAAATTPAPAATEPGPATPPEPASALPEQGKPCDAEGRCAAGLRCMAYFGIAGTKGPKFTSCEIACAGGARCPDGQRCITIADGPGQVCRP